MRNPRDNPITRRIVSKDGGATFNTIQEAIDSIELDYNERAVIQIYPGIYPENLVSQSGISFAGLGASNKDVQIQATSGIALDIPGNPPQISTVLQNLSIIGYNNTEIIHSLGGKVEAFDCNLELEVTTSNPESMFYTGPGAFLFKNTYIRYEHMDELFLPTQTNKMFEFEDNIGNKIVMDSCEIFNFLWDGNDFYVFDEELSDGINMYIKDNRIDIQVGGTSPTPNLRFLNAIRTSSRYAPKVFHGNLINLRCDGEPVSSARATVYYLNDANMEIQSFGNRIIVEGFDYNYAGEIVQGQVTTHFDDIDAEHLYDDVSKVNVAHTHEQGEMHVQRIKLDDKLYSTQDLTSFISTDSKAVMQIETQTEGSTGGDCHILDVSQISPLGSCEVTALATHNDVNVVDQLIGVVPGGFLSKAWRIASGVPTLATTAFATSDPGGPNNFALFTTNADSIQIGANQKFDVIRVVLEIVASVPGINTTFEYWTASGWTVFSPIDGTLSFQQSGTIHFSIDGLVGWVTTQLHSEVDGPWYYVQLTRNRALVPTTPVEDTIVQLNTFDGNWSWDKNGKITIDQLISASKMKMPTVSTVTGLSGLRGEIVLADDDDKVYFCKVESPATWEPLN